MCQEFILCFENSLSKVYRKENACLVFQIRKLKPVCGYRNHSGGGFYNLDAEADWWSSSIGGTGSWERALNTSNTSVYRGAVARSNGLSVRCVRDLMIEIDLSESYRSWFVREYILNPTGCDKII